jgi:hypothetical protein
MEKTLKRMLMRNKYRQQVFLDNLHGGELAAPHHLVDKISGQDLDYLTCGSTDSLAEIQSVNHSLILVMADQLLSNGRIVSRRV